MITNNLFVKYQKGIKRGIIIGIVVLLVGIGVILVGGMRQVENEENALYFNDILEGDGEKVGKFSYLNVTGDAYMFAQYGDNDDYCYFVYDDQYYYIIRMSEKEYNKLFNNGDSVVRVEGTVSKIDEDIRKLAIDGFNEYYEEDIYVGYRYYDSYEVEPRYPFGYGLSYADFYTHLIGFSQDEMTAEFHVNVITTNTQ